jgi:DNA-binding LacI/PurR family transcriptional regulator
MESSLKKAKYQVAKRLTIGLMIDNVDDDYQRTIWAGVEQAAAEADVNVACFLGGDLNPADESTYLHNNIFKLISSESLDGLIVVSTCLATYIGNEKLREYCRPFESLPMVSLGFRLEGISSILAENQLGIKSIMDHLIEDHGYTKFLFIGGPSTNSDTVERQRLFIESLKAHGIEIKPELITCANFHPHEAYRVIENTLDRKLEFEAVVSANDEMAIGALAALRDRNILVPDQVAITGFDDIMSARYLVLPLTTVRQPTFEMSKMAMEMILQKIKKQKTKDLEFFKTRVVIRRSCGCLSHEAVKASVSGIKPKKCCFEADSPRFRKAVFEEIRAINTK